MQPHAGRVGKLPRQPVRAQGREVMKLSRRDLPVALATRADGATTVTTWVPGGAELTRSEIDAYTQRCEAERAAALAYAVQFERTRQLAPLERRLRELVGGVRPVPSLPAS